jgi:hypothetical protein
LTVPQVLGIPGASVESGDHLCAFYRGLAERDEILLPYLRAGLHAEEKCICIIDASEPSVVLDRIGDGIDVDGCVASGQLEVRTSDETYFRTGGFSIAEMVEFWDAAVGGAITGGRFSCSRAVGEMSWALRDAPGVDLLVDYESEINRFAPQYPQLLLCLYDLERFGGEIVVELLKTHPKMLVSGMVLENPYYQPPDEFSARRR